MEDGGWRGEAVGLFCAFQVDGARWRFLARDGTGWRALANAGTGETGVGCRCAWRASIGPGGVARLGPRSRNTRGKGGVFGWNRGKYFYFSGLWGCAPGRLTA